MVFGGMNKTCERPRPGPGRQQTGNSSRHVIASCHQYKRVQVEPLPNEIGRGADGFALWSIPFRSGTDPYPQIRVPSCREPDLLANGRQFVHARYRQRSVSHGETDSLGGTRADVAGREDPGDGGFQRARVTVLQRPSTGSQDIDTRQNIAKLISRQRFWQPGATRLGADENKSGGNGQGFR